LRKGRQTLILAILKFKRVRVMKKIRSVSLATLVTAFLIFNNVSAQTRSSNLPACKGTDASAWDMCFGTENLLPTAPNYTGEWKKGEYNGQGTVVLIDGQKYVGTFKDGDREGYGIHTLPDGRNYVGAFKNDMFNGRGTYTYIDGSKYVGEFKDGVRSGQGTLTSSDGTKYEGEWKSDKPDGLGQLQLANGNKYAGGFKDHKLNGQGTYIFADGRKFVGEFKDGAANGKVTATFPDGSKYVGQVKDFAYYGTGAITDGEGNVTSGEFKNNKLEGQGYETFKNGDKYVGQFKDDLYDGSGVFTWANGDKYVGEYKAGNFNGQGLLTFANGTKRIGLFKDGKYVGEQQPPVSVNQQVTQPSNSASLQQQPSAQVATQNQTKDVSANLTKFEKDLIEQNLRAVYSEDKESRQMLGSASDKVVRDWILGKFGQLSTNEYGVKTLGVIQFVVFGGEDIFCTKDHNNHKCYLYLLGGNTVRNGIYDSNGFKLRFNAIKRDDGSFGFEWKPSR
jgi:hypothetical protein